MERLLYGLGYAVRETGQALDRLGLTLQGSRIFREELSRHRTILPLFGKVPSVPASAFVAPSASVVGDVTIGERSSIWYSAVLRGDVNKITVGNDTNIQDGSVIHVAKTNLNGKLLPTIVGDRVTVGHKAILHACTVQDDCLIGMGATVMDEAVIEKNSIVAAGAVVTTGTVVKSGEIWAGNPAKLLRKMTADETAFIPKSAATYAELGEQHSTECAKSFEEVEEDKFRREDIKYRGEDYKAQIGVMENFPAKA
mmetsp:Transcript_9774/g.35806  ORF Transcript_9774/g.35806 Transcript_9774/m.35806 type:complete len:254 (-) Transcript_9774:123-884(-)